MTQIKTEEDLKHIERFTGCKSEKTSSSVSAKSAASADVFFCDCAPKGVQPFQGA
jgi:hypothetical protein